MNSYKEKLQFWKRLNLFNNFHLYLFFNFIFLMGLYVLIQIRQYKGEESIYKLVVGPIPFLLYLNNIIMGLSSYVCDLHELESQLISLNQAVESNLSMFLLFFAIFMIICAFIKSFVYLNVAYDEELDDKADIVSRCCVSHDSKDVKVGGSHAYLSPKASSTRKDVDVRYTHNVMSFLNSCIMISEPLLTFMLENVAKDAGLFKEKAKELDKLSSVDELTSKTNVELKEVEVSTSSASPPSSPRSSKKSKQEMKRDSEFGRIIKKQSSTDNNTGKILTPLKNLTLDYSMIRFYTVKYFRIT